MARVILIHGIAQEQKGAAQLENEWLPAMADGLRSAGYPKLAADLWPDRAPRKIDVRMAFYGDIFVDPAAQGGDLDIDALTPEQRELMAAIGEEWLQHAEQRPEHPDRDVAVKEMGMLASDDPAQGRVAEFTRTVMNAVANLRWFAIGGVGLAERFVVKSLAQVTLYLTRPDLQAKIDKRVLDLVDDETEIIIGHSLGSVVAYQVAASDLRRELPLLVTLGSPLGLHSVIYERIRPQPPTFPELVHRWGNIADRDDLVAAQPDLTDMFPVASDSQRLECGVVDNGSKPHQAEHYLGKRQVGAEIGAVLAS